MNETRSRSSERAKEIKDVKDLMDLPTNIERQSRESMPKANELEMVVQLQRQAASRVTLKTLLKQSNLQRGERLAAKLTLVRTQIRGGERAERETAVQEGAFHGVL